MRQAPDVRGGDDIRRPERSKLAAAQLPRNSRLQERVGARRAAAEVRVGHWYERIASLRQQRLDLPAQLLAVLQRARRLERNRAALSTALDHVGSEHLTQVARQRRDA